MFNLKTIIIHVNKRFLSWFNQFYIFSLNIANKFTWLDCKSIINKLLHNVLILLSLNLPPVILCRSCILYSVYNILCFILFSHAHTCLYVMHYTLNLTKLYEYFIEINNELFINQIIFINSPKDRFILNF